jgi:hypothetical protein
MITCSEPVGRNPVHKVIKPALSSQGKLLDLDSEAFRFPHKSSCKFMVVHIRYRYRFYNKLILNLSEKAGTLEQNTTILIVKTQLPARLCSRIGWLHLLVITLINLKSTQKGRIFWRTVSMSRTSWWSTRSCRTWTTHPIGSPGRASIVKT